MDQTKYVNSYIETLMATLQEYIVSQIQLKSQVKVLNETITEKDQVINDMTQRINNNTSIESEYHKAIKRNQSLENENNELKNKTSHMDLLAQQLNSFKSTIIEKDAKIIELQSQIEKQQEMKPKKIKQSKKTDEVSLPFSEIVGFPEENVVSITPKNLQLTAADDF